MRRLVLLSAFFFCTSALAHHTAQQALNQNKDLAAAFSAIKSAAGIECDANESFLSSQPAGPEGKNSFTQQIPCYDDSAFNPSQLGQLTLTYYGSEENGQLSVGKLIKIDFEVFK